MFYLFDSHERDSSGFHSENGASVLLQFDSLDEVLLFLFDHYTGYSYEFTPVLFPTSFTSNSPDSNERKRKSETVNPICRNEVTTTNNITINSYLNQHSCSIRVEKNFDHNYFSKKLVSKRKKCMYRKNTGNCQMEVDDNHHNKHDNSHCSSVNDMIGVLLVCNVSTAVNMTFIDYIVHSNHNASFEQLIREKPVQYCKCCNRFLFRDMAYFRNINNATRSLDILPADNLCETCRSKLVQNLVPSISVKSNFLGSGNIPGQLQHLSPLEKN